MSLLFFYGLDLAAVCLAAAVGLVFGLHPLQVESVAWVAERRTLLCALFMMGSLCAYVQAAQQPQFRHALQLLHRSRC